MYLNPLDPQSGQDAVDMRQFMTRNAGEEKRLLTVGRGRQCDIRMRTNSGVAQMFVEGSHGVFEASPGHLRYKDTSGKKGTFVNDVVLEGDRWTELKKNDIISFGGPTRLQAASGQHTQCSPFQFAYEAEPRIQPDPVPFPGPDPDPQSEADGEHGAVPGGVTHEFPSAVTCSICMDLKNDPCILECGHSFCGSCICEWIKRNPVCPKCRADTSHDPVADIDLEMLIKECYEQALGPEELTQRRKRKRVAATPARLRVQTHSLYIVHHPLDGMSSFFSV